MISFKPQNKPINITVINLQMKKPRLREGMGLIQCQSTNQQVPELGTESSLPCPLFSILYQPVFFSRYRIRGNCFFFPCAGITRSTRPNMESSTYGKVLLGNKKQCYSKFCRPHLMLGKPRSGGLLVKHWLFNYSGLTCHVGKPWVFFTAFL